MSRAGACCATASSPSTTAERSCPTGPPSLRGTRSQPPWLP